MIEEINEQIIEYEKELLAICVFSKEASMEIFSVFSISDFILSKHKEIYKLLLSNQNINSIVDLNNAVTDANLLQLIGGYSYISSICSKYYSDENYTPILNFLKEQSKYRKLKVVLNNIENKLEKDTSVQSIISDAQQEILNIDIGVGIGTNIKKINEIIPNVTNQIKDRNLKTGNVLGIPTCYADLDKLTSGWQESDLIILAARPSMGKTALALNFAHNAALKGRGVAFFSLEMSNEQLCQRLISLHGSINGSKIRYGTNFNKVELQQISDTSDQLSKLNIVIDDTPSLNTLNLHASLRKMQRDYGVELCIVDYLQLLSSNNDSLKKSGRNVEVAEISRDLKIIARTLKIPIICISQLSRSVEKREDKKPIMSDLRDSGAIEQDADIIMFLYRENYYKKSESDTDAELIISKHRNGPTGDIKLEFDKNIGSFKGIKSF